MPSKNKLVRKLCGNYFCGIGIPGRLTKKFPPNPAPVLTQEKTRKLNCNICDAKCFSVMSTKLVVFLKLLP